MESAGSVIEPFRTGPDCGIPAMDLHKRVLLISNRVMHYRVSVYNYFWRRFREHGWEFVVLSNELQRQNHNRCEFELIERPFDFLQIPGRDPAHQSGRGHSISASQGSNPVAVDSLAQAFRNSGSPLDEDAKSGRSGQPAAQSILRLSPSDQRRPDSVHVVAAAVHPRAAPRQGIRCQ